ncbi:MAG: glycoside hydrolase family 15 protein [Salinibacterium sp.]|nr:glycoside hydrolase family 15 protein [Salinibacterium sp.]
MAMPIEDYAMIGDTHTAALIGRDGSIDWLCVPRFDSASVFGALLGDENHGRWLLAPEASLHRHPGVTSTRHYIDDTFTLVTRWVTPTGDVEVTEFMPLGDSRADIVRRVRGLSGSVVMHVDLRIRFDYANAIPWVRQVPQKGHHVLLAVAGPDAIAFRGPKLHPEDHNHTANFVVEAGETIDMTLTWYRSHREPPVALKVTKRLRETTWWWQKWASACVSHPEYHDAVRRSLLVLRALTHEDTGGIVAAATTSLPESFGGSRNWDYRYVWLRDASLTLHVLLEHGFTDEADSWRNWLLRAIAGDPSDVQIMYGLAGERRLSEWEVPSLPGYQGASPVRVGNGAFTQFQGDVFGEVMIALQAARRLGTDEPDFSWPVQRALMSFVEDNWERPDHGIWEIRGPQQYFTHSRVMLWAALDCAICAVNDFGLEGPAARWTVLRDKLRDEIEAKGFDRKRNTYTQYYGSAGVDASLLQLAQVGYLAADDPRMLGTVAAIESELVEDGLVLRYRTETGVDGLPAGENPFLACSFWLVEQYANSARLDDARALMERLLGFTNDVGLLSEEYDVGNSRQAGNTPQALTHLTLVRAADAIAKAAARVNGKSGLDAAGMR